MYLCVCFKCVPLRVFVPVSRCQFLYQCFCICVCLCVSAVCVTVCVSVCLCLCLRLCLCVCGAVCLCVCVSLCVSVCLCVSLCVSVCLCVSMCVDVCLCVWVQSSRDVASAVVSAVAATDEAQVRILFLVGKFHLANPISPGLSDDLWASGPLQIEQVRKMCLGPSVLQMDRMARAAENMWLVAKCSQSANSLRWSAPRGVSYEQCVS
jgi:hypothetical protein